MNKFDLALDPAAMPERIFALPELSCPDRLNIAQAVFADAEANGWLGRTAYLCEGRRWSYGDLIAGTKRVAGALRAAGVGPEDRVILRMRDSPELVMALLAVKGLGAIAIRPSCSSAPTTSPTGRAIPGRGSPSSRLASWTRSLTRMTPAAGSHG